MTGPNASTALAYAKAQHAHASQDWSNQCLKFVRTSYGAPAMGGDAHSAWDAAKVKHPRLSDRDTAPPKGVPVFFRGGPHGHTAISDGGGWCWSTDYKRQGKVDRVRIVDIERGWGVAYRGWTEDVNRTKVTGWDQPPAHKAHVTFTRTLKPGARGRDVKDYKGHLWHRKVKTGFYGPASVKLTKAVQRKNTPHLGTADGIVGPVTWRKVTGHK